MDLRKLQKLAVDALEDVKAKDIDVINTTKLTSLFDRIIVASGDSNRQVNALARNVHDKVKEAGGHIIGIEGEDGGEWVLVDLGDIVVHVMQPAVRTYYNIEELWAGAAPRRKEKSTLTPSEGRATPVSPGKPKSASFRPVARRVAGGVAAPDGAKKTRSRAVAKTPSGGKKTAAAPAKKRLRASSKGA